ncbi:MAG: hypothetical protein ABW076_11015 [Candidatus Thiodiazotropha sp.]
MRGFNAWKKVFIYSVALSGILINTGYAIGSLSALFEPGVILFCRQTLAVLASFEVGWVLLLLWFLFDPGRRRGVLLLSTVPILLASGAHSLLRGAGGSELVTNLAMVLGYCGCFLYAHHLAVAIAEKPN